MFKVDLSLSQKVFTDTCSNSNITNRLICIYIYIFIYIYIHCEHLVLNEIGSKLACIYIYIVDKLRKHAVHNYVYIEIYICSNCCVYM